MKYLITLLVSIMTALPLIGSISVDTEILIRGASLKILVDQATDTIKVTYRPNSQVEKIQYLTSPTPVTSFDWIPKNAGVVALDGKGESTTVSVRYPGISGSGLFIMLLAGFLLFGGAIYAFRLLMYGKPIEDIDIDVLHRPDT